MKILLTSTSFIDTTGKHHDLLLNTGYTIEFKRGPLKEEELIDIIDLYDAIICGDDEITKQVLLRGKSGSLKFISKYGIGLDKIDLDTAKSLGISVSNTPGVNHITVAEHVFALILSFYRNLYSEFKNSKNGMWIRITGHEMYGKTIGVIGLGRIGKELAIRMKSFGLKVLAYDKYPDLEFAEKNGISIVNNLVELVSTSDIISLNIPLNDDTKGIISERLFNCMTNKSLLVNTARANLVDKPSLINSLKNNKLMGYLTDVMWEEPMSNNDELLSFSNVYITPHIGSRTYDSVERQGIAAITNLMKMIKEYER